MDKTALVRKYLAGAVFCYAKIISVYISATSFIRKIVVGAPTAPLFCAKNTMYRKIFIGY